MHVDDEDRRTRKRKLKVKAADDWWVIDGHHGEQVPKEDEEAPQQLVCACGGDEKGHCIPTHPHHVGNVLADALAEKGKALECRHMHVQMLTDRRIDTISDGEDATLRYHMGEEAAVLVVDGNICQGGATKALANAVQARRLSQFCLLYTSPSPRD